MSTPDTNPYEVMPFPDSVASPDERSKPGPVAVVCSVIVGLLASVVLGIATFVATCLGVYEYSRADETSVAIAIPVAVLTGAAAFLFTYWGMLKLVKMFKR